MRATEHERGLFRDPNAIALANEASDAQSTLPSVVASRLPEELAAFSTACSARRAAVLESFGACAASQPALDAYTRLIDAATARLAVLRRPGS